MPIITVSRGSMSGGKAFAECVAAALGVPCVGREILIDAAAKLGVPEQVLAKKMERGPGLWERLTLERRVYVAAVQAALAEQIATGNLVYHGLAGHMLLRHVPAVLRLRLIAPLEVRIHKVMELQGLTRSAAESYINDVDADRLRWTRFMYDVDLRDPQLYDLVINIEKMSIPTACAMIVEAAKKPEFVVTESVRASLADFSVECRVRVAFATQPASRGLDLDVSVKNGVVFMSGEVPRAIMLAHTSSRWEQDLTQIAESVAGVVRAELNIDTFDAYH